MPASTRRLPHRRRAVPDRHGRGRAVARCRRSSTGDATLSSASTTFAGCSSSSRAATPTCTAVTSSPPNDDGADLGVVFFHNAGYSTACGHGTIALVTWALEEGILERHEGENRVVVDVPSGRLETVRGRLGRSCALGHLPQRAVVRLGDRTSRSALSRSTSPSAAPSTPRCASGWSRAELPRLIELGREIKRALEDRHEIVHPLEPELRDVYGVIFWQHERTRPVDAAERDRLRRRRGRPLAVRLGNVGTTRPARRRAAAAAWGRAAPSLDHRLLLPRSRRRIGRSRRAPRGRDGGDGVGATEPANLVVRARSRTIRSVRAFCCGRSRGAVDSEATDPLVMYLVVRRRTTRPFAELATAAAIATRRCATGYRSRRAVACRLRGLVAPFVPQGVSSRRASRVGESRALDHERVGDVACLPPVRRSARDRVFVRMQTLSGEQGALPAPRRRSPGRADADRARPTSA